MGFFSDAFALVTGSGVVSSLVKTALLIQAAKMVGPSTDPTKPADQPDPGVRLQLTPSPDNQIPVLYGEAYFGGNITDAVLAADYKKMTYCLTLSEVTGTLLSTASATSYTFKNVYLNNNRVVFKADGVTVDYTLDSSGNQDISARDLIKIYCYAGTTGLQPTGYTGTTPASYTVMPNWTQPTHPMTGLVYAIVEVTYSRDKGISGLPECIFNINSSMTLPGDVLYDYMTNTRYGAAIPTTEMYSASFASLNSYASTGFTYTNLSNQSTSSSITFSGVVDTTQPVLTNIKSMADCASSWVGYDITAGLWSITINQTGTSVASFSDSNIIGDISISGTSLTQLSNSYKVDYQNTDILDKLDFVKVSIPSASWFANEIATTAEMNLPFINKQVVATKIGLQALKQARVDKIIQFKADFSYIDLKSGELIDITSSIYGFTNKVFRIVTITEVDTDNTIQLEFTCLEYDSAVYTYNISQYSVLTDGGILSIGSIGKANTPTITKTESSNLPNITISAAVPSGIVDNIEYWITTDTTIANDVNRNYTLIAKIGNPNGSVLTEDDIITYTYSPLSSGNFFIKVRGANNVATGPFSDPSGLIAYVPSVVADTISDNPVSIGGQLMSLGLLTLLNNLDKLFTGTTTAGSLFDKVFNLFKDVTGVDLIGQASGGTLVVASELAIKEEGTTLTPTTSSINFVGDNVTATNTGNAVTVTITGGGYTGDELWTTDTANSVTEIYEVDGVGVERFTTIVFDRPTGDKISLQITWP